MNTIKFIISILVCLMIVVACNKNKKNETSQKEQTKYGYNAKDTTIKKETTIRDIFEKYDTTKLRKVIIDGYDKTTKTTLPRLNVWEDYETREFAFALNHGTKVWMLDRDGDGVKIITRRGRIGWITYWFIKELK